MAGGALLMLFSFLLFFAILFFGKGVRLYTDWLWFAETGYLSVFLTELKARLAVGGGLGIFSFLWLWSHFLIARAARNAPRFILPGDWLEFPQRRQILQYIDRVAPGLFVMFSFILGIGLAGWWRDVLAFLNRVPFNAADPVFQKDIGFYVFAMPLLDKIYQFGPFLLFAALVVSVGSYTLQRDIQINDDRLHVSPQAHWHLAGLAALFFLWKSAGYLLDSYGLLFAPSGAAFGASYTDLAARLPVLRLLQFTALLAGLSLLVPAVKRQNRAWLVPGAFVGLWLAVLIVGYGIYPSAVQRFRVVPNEISLETPYIERNIEHTRRAYGLDKVTEKSFSAAGSLSLADVEENRPTLDNIRLWDHRPLLATFSQLQEIRTYYKFTGVDNDRYQIDGETRQMMLSVRELDHKSLPSRMWINEHLTYTHGFGLVMGPVNEVTSEGLPRLMVKDIPPVATPELEIKRPEIYFGEISNDYVIVKTKAKELDYPAGDQNVYADYTGRGGISLANFFRRVAFSLRFGDMKLLLSSDITPESRLLFNQQIMRRARQIAPFFFYDSDPYAVVSDGRVRWILDGYTWTDRYPYSQPVRGAFNYLRNSVKVVVDAYDGSVDFYQANDEDPVVRMYARIFPGLLKPLSEMPADLRSHLRYPQDLFEVQSDIYARFHMVNPQVFYNQEDLWTTPNEIAEGGEQPMQPYYTVMRLPGEKEEEYILMQPFTPSKKSNLIAWMAARSDGDRYGELLVFRFPKERLVYGPMQIEARIDQDPQISEQFTLWSQSGVQILRGNLLVIPIEDSLLYIEPIYLQAERGRIPELRRVVVSYQDRISMGETLDQALRGVFTGWTAKKLSGPGSAGFSADILPARLGAEAWTIYQRGQDALRRGDWSAYGQANKELGDVLRRLKSEATSK